MRCRCEGRRRALLRRQPRRSRAPAQQPSRRPVGERLGVTSTSPASPPVIASADVRQASAAASLLADPVHAARGRRRRACCRSAGSRAAEHLLSVIPPAGERCGSPPPALVVGHAPPLPPGAERITPGRRGGRRGGRPEPRPDRSRSSCWWRRRWARTSARRRGRCGTSGSTGCGWSPRATAGRTRAPRRWRAAPAGCSTAARLCGDDRRGLRRSRLRLRHHRPRPGADQAGADPRAGDGRGPGDGRRRRAGRRAVRPGARRARDRRRRAGERGGLGAGQPGLSAR